MILPKLDSFGNWSGLVMGSGFIRGMGMSEIQEDRRSDLIKALQKIQISHHGTDRSTVHLCWCSARGFNGMGILPREVVEKAIDELETAIVLHKAKVADLTNCQAIVLDMLISWVESDE